MFKKSMLVGLAVFVLFGSLACQKKENPAEPTTNTEVKGNAAPEAPPPPAPAPVPTAAPSPAPHDTSIITPAPSVTPPSVSGSPANVPPMPPPPAAPAASPSAPSVP